MLYGQVGTYIRANTRTQRLYTETLVFILSMEVLMEWNMTALTVTLMSGKSFLQAVSS